MASDFLSFIIRNWNSLFHYFWDLIYPNLLIVFLLVYSGLFYFYFISSITNQFNRVVFAFIFGCEPFLSLLERNFKISKTKVAKISLKSSEILTYYLKNMFLLALMLQDCCSFCSMTYYF